MPSSIYLGAYANFPEMLEPEIVWEIGDWFDLQSDSGLQGLGDYNPMTTNPSGPSSSTVPDTSVLCTNCAGPPAQGYPSGCPSNMLPVDVGGDLPICMDAATAIGYGAGAQVARTPAPTGLLGIPSSAVPWLLGGAFVLLLTGFGGGRRR